MNVKKILALLFFVTAFAAVATSQQYGNTTSGLIPGPSMERDARRGYASVDYYRNNGYYGGYNLYPYGDYYGNGRLGTSAIVGGVAGAITGGLVAYATTRGNNRTMYVTAEPSRGQYYAEPQRRQVIFAAPKPQKPLDCRKNKNRQACEAFAEQARQEAEAREAERLAKKLYNRTGLPLDVSDCGKLVFPLRVNQNTWAPEAKCGYVGHMLVPDRDTAGLTVRIKADFRLADDRSGWVFTAPKVEEN
jgi:hypothetical protein